MIRLSVFYPKTEGTTFDYDYFRESLEAMNAAMSAPGAEALQEDVAN